MALCCQGIGDTVKELLLAIDNAAASSGCNHLTTAARNSVPIVGKFATGNPVYFDIS